MQRKRSEFSSLSLSLRVVAVFLREGNGFGASFLSEVDEKLFTIRRSSVVPLLPGTSNTS